MITFIRNLLKWIRELIGIEPIPDPEPIPAPLPPAPQEPQEDDIPFQPATFPANWCFSPDIFKRRLYWPISNNGGSEHGGNCHLKMLSKDGWVDALVMGPDPGTEDICRLPVYNGEQYVIPETNDGIYKSKSGDPGSYIRCKKFKGKNAGEYGAFDACVHGVSLKVPVAGFHAGHPLVLWSVDGELWNPVRTWQASGERPTGWACGSDGIDFFIGIAGFARGTTSNTRFDGIWAAREAGWFHEGPGVKAQSFLNCPLGMLAGAHGAVHRRIDVHAWPVVFRVGSRFVVSLCWIGDILYIGGEDPPAVYITRDLIAADKKEWSGPGPAYVGEYQGKPVVSRWEEGLAIIELL
jgi:hypothetical protein